MDQHSDPNLITVKVTLPGPDGDTIVRKFKVTIAQLHKDVIHNTVIPPRPALFLLVCECAECAGCR